MSRCAWTQRSAAMLALAIALAACHSDPPEGLETAELVPLPQTMSIAPGTMRITAGTRIIASAGAEPIASMLATALRPATGLWLPVVADATAAIDGDLLLSLRPDLTALGEEGYRLSTVEGVATLTAAAPAGLFYATQTLRQLLPPESGSATRVEGIEWRIPHLTIEDAPRYRWRGAMLDVARHFFDVATVERLIDLIAYHKLNRLHLHLSDDQGWRIQIDSWPALTAIGGSTAVGGGPGGYFTKADYAAIVAYAGARFITVVPEVDMPGHTNAALASYPELNESGEAPQLYTGTEVGFSSLWIGAASTDRFIEEVIGELAAITPGPYLHIGGDEANATDAAAYTRFIEQLHAVVSGHGKQMIGWEEIGRADLRLAGAPPLAQHWINPLRAREAAAQGVCLIASPATNIYLDMRYDRQTPIGAIWVGFVDLQRAYDWDPDQLIPEIDPALFEGVEAPLWTETVATPADIDLLMFPRLCGAAEIAWTPRPLRDWVGYRARLAAHGRRLTAMGVGFYRSQQVDWTATTRSRD